MDDLIANSTNLVVGANEKDYHLRNANYGAYVTYDAEDLNQSGPMFAWQAENFHLFPRSVSPEYGFRASLQAGYWLESESKSVLDPRFPKPLEYGHASGALEAFLPGFFAHHVLYGRAFASGVFGPDRHIERTRLAGRMRGLNIYRSPLDHSVSVLTAEYRLPVFWHSRELFRGWPEIMPRQFSAALFLDYGAAFDKRAAREDWRLSYGVRFGAGVQLWHLPSPLQIEFTVARGMGGAGELQTDLAFRLGPAPALRSGLQQTQFPPRPHEQYAARE